MNIKTLIATILMVGTTTVYATPKDLIDVRGLYLDYKNFSKKSHNPLITDYGPKGRGMGIEVDLHMDIDLGDVFYWNNMVHSLTDTNFGAAGQYRLIGWNYQLGIRPTSWLSVEYNHFSKHLLDSTFPYPNPVEDSIGFRIYFISPVGKEAGSIW